VSLDVLVAAFGLRELTGGAERHLAELVDELRRRGHRVRAVGGVDGPDRSWAARHARCQDLAVVVAAALPADVVLTQLHAAPAAVCADVPAVLLLPSFESLCKHAFGLEPCPPPRDCRACPAAVQGGAALAALRAGQDRALRAAHTLVAPSATVAAAVRDWCGRDPQVVAPVGEPPTARGTFGGPVVMAAARWAPHKGAELIEPIREALAPRHVEVRSGTTDEILDGAHAVVVPSLGIEAFGRIAWEAQSAGIPVVASAVGGLREHVAPEGLADPNAEALAAKVRALDERANWDRAVAAALAAADAITRTRPLARAADLVQQAAPSPH
jgi:glycosyltransferase involved in cell wall biosynthesis